MNLRTEFFVIVALLWAIVSTSAPVGAQSSGDAVLQAKGQGVAVNFASDVFPILQRSCLECHGPKKQEASLRLDQPTAMWESEVVVAGDPDASELIRRIALPRHHEELMPAVGEPLSSAQIQILRQWIADGAVWPENFVAAKHWAYEIPVRAELPASGDDSWSRSPIDTFVLRRIKGSGLQPSPVAEPETLVRRLFFDLIGLPPTPLEVEAFMHDPSDTRYGQLVDDLLLRAQFGEKWARPWLDLARYSDSHGFQRDDLRDNWAWRDWVIRALNDDMPFDQFTIEQIAGDLLPAATESQKIATGFHRCAATNVEAGSLPEETRAEQLIDRVNTTATVWLGTTLECAQCHDHKFDPFTQVDYYRLLAFFNNTAIEADRTNPKQPSSIAFQGPSMVIANPERDRQRETLQVKLRELELEADARQLKKQIAAVKKDMEKLTPETTLVMIEQDSPRPAFVFTRGDYRQRGADVQPGTPAILHRLSASQPADPPNRLTLAKWLVDPSNPLVARVTVNRWWLEIFGQGLATTPEDFGIKGEQPSHLELLDWLAVEFMEHNWSMKHVLRTIVLSSTYRQSSHIPPERADADDQNRMLARGPRFRLNAEAIRDNALAISGLLDLQQFGPPIRPAQPDGLWAKVGGQQYDYVVSAGTEKYRRGIYVVLKRSAPYPSFVNFDASARLACTVRRSRTNTPLQALTLLNDPVYVEAARALARRVLKEKSETDVAGQIEFAFQLCTSRVPTQEEREMLHRLLDAQSLAFEQRVEDANRIAGDAAAELKIKSHELAAWYSMAAVLLNLHETITKP